MGLFKKKKPNEFSAARYGDVFRSARTRERRHMRRKWQWILLGVLLLVGFAAGFAFYKYNQLEDKLHRGAVELPPPEEGRPFNALIVGSDSRGDLTPQQQERLGANAVEGQRADTLILAHVDPATNKVTMVQFPRDLWVPVDGGSKSKINAALEGGSRDLVRTVRDLTGLEINHYIQVNIAGFRDLVNAIDGVNVCIPEPIQFDENTGLEITADEVGMVHFDGDEALRFVRSRHTVEGGDFGRIANQQKFLAAALEKVTSVGTLLNPARLLSLVDIAGDNLRTDVNTTPFGLRRLLQRFRTFDPEHYEAYTVPNFGPKLIDVGGVDVSIVDPNFQAMELMFSAIDENESPAAADGVPSIDPATIHVGVYNGTLEEGLADETAADLEQATLTATGSAQIEEVANAGRLNYKGSVIRWDPGRPETEKMAKLVGAALPDAKVVKGKVSNSDVDVEVIVGTRPLRARRIVQILPLPLPVPGRLPAVCASDAASG